MNCFEVRELLGSYVEGAVADDVRAAVEVHLPVCATCRAELATHSELAKALARAPELPDADALWSAIEPRLSMTPPAAESSLSLRRVALAASLVFAIGVGVLALVLFGHAATPAEASPVDFGVLLDALDTDAETAFSAFLARYHATAITAADAHHLAPDLSFALPPTLAGGFSRRSVHALRFGDTPGIAAAYVRHDDFLAVIFHRPVQQEDYGSHQDYPCVIGHHRGHMVEKGPWRLIHVTDPQTCHCILSRLDPVTELPPIIAEVTTSP